MDLSRHPLAANQRPFLLAAWGAIALWHALGPLPWAGQVGLLALLAAAGLPHGGLDLALIAQLPARQRPPAALLYAALGGLVIGVWMYWPGPSLAAFLLVSWLHFGTSDGLQPRGPAAWLEAIARGGLPLTLPAAFYADQVTLLFGLLAPQNEALWIATWLAHGLWLALAAALAWAGWVLLERSPQSRRTGTELISILALFALLPPLPAFALYFALLHAARSSERVLAKTEAPRRYRTLSLVATALTLAFALAAFSWLPPLTANHHQAAIQVVFIGLAALTWPHVLLHAFLPMLLPGEPHAPSQGLHAGGANGIRRP